MPATKPLNKKSLPELLKTCQQVFNKFIRERDKDKGCISCPGKVQEAGHYFSRGHHGALRFNEMNVNGQCTRCNCFLHGNLINYRNGLVKRYGEDKVLLLESCKNNVKKWTRVELEVMIKFYKQELTRLSGG